MKYKREDFKINIMSYFIKGTRIGSLEEFTHEL